MMTDLNKESHCFTGEVGTFVQPSEFPEENYVITKGKYDYEGNWAFCVFDHPYIVGARIGYGTGQFDARDYFPNANAPDPSYMQVHVEIMTADGAYQWVNSVDFKADHLDLVQGKFQEKIVRNGKEVLHLSGWPDINWNMASDDGSIVAEMQLQPETVTILPDNLMPSQIFGMFLAFCNIKGKINLEGQEFVVSGTSFYDHTRILATPTDAPPYGMNFYTPVRLNDGSYLGAYFTTDHKGQPRDGYCFAVYAGADGTYRYIKQHSMSDIKLDADHLPESWKSRLNDGDLNIEMKCTARPIDLKKGWGNPAPASRRDNYNFPLVFDTEIDIELKGVTHSKTGTGLAEYLMGGHQIPD